MAKEKLTPADKKFIAKFFGEVDFSARTIKRRNRFTGVEIEVDPVFALMFDFILRLEAVIFEGKNPSFIHPDLKHTNAIKNFDRARMIALKMDSNAYMELLD